VKLKFTPLQVYRKKLPLETKFTYFQNKPFRNKGILGRNCAELEVLNEIVGEKKNIQQF